jgi:hypothetical protein
VERHLARIAREADRLEQLIARTLNLARLERPAQALERAAVNIAELLQNIVADVAIEARNLQAGGLVVTITLPPLGRGTSGHSFPWGRVARASRRSSGFPKLQAGEAKAAGESPAQGGEQCARHPALPSSSHVEETATRGVIAAVAKTAPVAVEDL